MKTIFDSEKKSVISFEKGEEGIAMLGELAEKRGTSFHFSMIGGCSSVDLAFYDMKKKEYEIKNHAAENIEIVTITGNVAWYDGKPLVHAHGVFSNEQYECFGGHIMKLVFSAIGETVIDWLPVKMERELQAESGLKVLCGE